MPEAAPQPAPSQSGATPGTFLDPYRRYNFKLQIQGVTEGHFTAVGGLEVEVQPIRYREGGASQVVHVIPGRVEYGDVELRYGLTASQELWTWLQSAVKGTVERKNVSIIMLDSAGAQEVCRWDLTNAWPSRWRGAPLDAMSQEVAIESMTLVCETLQKA
jgi:phage tail-like protein